MSDFFSAGEDDKPLSVSALTAQIKQTLESDFRNVYVEGEISNLTFPASGHVYFKLKDSDAIINAVMWRSAKQRCRVDFREGDKVACRARMSLFEKRGEYQIVVERLTLSGEGDLYAQFQRLKAKLEAEGLFDKSRKRSFSRYPLRVGIVTSPTGAVIRDMLTVLRRRAPAVSVLLYPAAVQGKGAARELVEGVKTLGRVKSLDVIIIGRGGGSMEDLWEFNDEQLARAIVACPIPVISAVGHETDFTIADFVADLRAPTPSAAAEIISEGYVSLREDLRERVLRLDRTIQIKLREERRRLQGLLQSYALRQPENLLREYQQRLDYALDRQRELLKLKLERLDSRVRRANSSLIGHDPALILKKGYGIIRKKSDASVISSVDRLKKNMAVTVELRDGQRDAIVTDNQADDLFS